MYVIVCLDDHQGMLFNKRRQSRDKNVIENIWGMTDQLWINGFSQKLLQEQEDKLIIDEKFLEKAGEGEYCFVENQKLKPYETRIEKVIVYYWNRKYPSDFKLDLELQDYQVEFTEEFEGSSHEKITKTIYVK